MTTQRIKSRNSYTQPPTGISDDLRKVSRASRDPSVEACTNTPFSDNFTSDNTSFNISDNSSCFGAVKMITSIIFAKIIFFNTALRHTTFSKQRTSTSINTLTEPYRCQLHQGSGPHAEAGLEGLSPGPLLPPGGWVWFDVRFMQFLRIFSSHTCSM